MDSYSSNGSDALSIIRECISKLEEAASAIEGEESSEPQQPSAPSPASSPVMSKPSSGGGKMALALAGIKKGLSKSK